MGGDFKSVVGKFYRLDFTLLIDKDVVHTAALLANKVLMPMGERVEALRSTQYQHLELFVDYEFLQISVNGSEADIGKCPADFLIDLVGGGMRRVVFNGTPDDFKLLGFSWLFYRHV
jgi:hypothetical protein